MDNISKSLLVKLMRLGSSYLLEAAKLIEEENNIKIENDNKTKIEKALVRNELIKELPLENEIIAKEPKLARREISEENSNKIPQKDQVSSKISSVITKAWKNNFAKTSQESPLKNEKSAKIVATPPKVVKKISGKGSSTKKESQLDNKTNSSNSENSENSDTDTEQDDSDSLDGEKFIRKYHKPNE